MKLIPVAVLLAGCARAAGQAPDAALADAAIDAARPDAAIDAARPDAAIDAAPATLTSVSVAQPTTVAAGLTAQLVATGHYSDNSTRDVTSTVTWASDATSVATVDAAGLVTTHATGSATITATLGSQTGRVVLAVDPAALVNITVTAASTSPVPKGATVQLAVTGQFTDGSSSDVSARALWTTSDVLEASVSTSGLVTAMAAAGTVDIHATIDALDAKVTLTDAPPKAIGLAITSGDLTLAQHQRARLHANLLFTDGTTQDVSAAAAWTTSAPTVVSVSGAVVDAQGVVSTATLTATDGGFTATAHAAVTGTACHPVINEVQSAGASAGDEWVELYNPCTVAIAVGGWTLDYRGATTVGSQDTNLLATLVGTMQPGELRLYVGPAFTGTATPDGAAWGGANGLLAATSGALGLRSGAKDTGTLVDAVAYGTITAGNPFVEGAAAAALASSKSVARTRFDGDDTNSNATDLALVGLPTPKALNAP